MTWVLQFDGDDDYLDLGTQLTCTNFDLVYDVDLLWNSGWLILAGGDTSTNLIRCDITESSTSVLCRFNKSTVRTLTIPSDIRNFNGKIKLSFRPGGTVSIYLDDVLQDTQTNASDTEFILANLQKYDVFPSTVDNRVRSISYIDYDGSDSFYLDATLSDHNSTTITDTIGVNDAQLAGGMTAANWFNYAESVYCPESNLYYKTLEAWLAAEAGSTFKTAVIFGTVITSGVFQLRDDNMTGGGLIRAASGQEFDASNVNADCATILGSVRIVSRNNSIYHNIKDVKIDSADLYGTATDNPQGFFKNCLFRKTSSSETTDLFALSSEGATNGFIENCVFDGVGANSVVDGIFSSAVAPNFTVKNCMAVDVPRFGFIRAKFINNLVLNSASSGSGSDFFQLQTGSDYNASSDTTATGANSFINKTTAVLVDYAGGDWRTSLASQLAVGGESGGYIGAAIEESSGAGEIFVTGVATGVSTTLADGTKETLSEAVSTGSSDTNSLMTKEVFAFGTSQGSSNAVGYSLASITNETYGSSLGESSAEGVAAKSVFATGSSSATSDASGYPILGTLIFTDGLAQGSSTTTSEILKYLAASGNSVGTSDAEAFFNKVVSNQAQGVSLGTSFAQAATNKSILAEGDSFTTSSASSTPAKEILAIGSSVGTSTTIGVGYIMAAGVLPPQGVKFEGYLFNVEITGVTNTNVYPSGSIEVRFDEQYLRSHEFRDATNNVSGVKVGDEITDYTRKPNL